MKRQTDGELDDGRLTEGLTGEATVYKRRGMAKPEMGRPQLKWVIFLMSPRRFTDVYVGPNVFASSLTLARPCG